MRFTKRNKAIKRYNILITVLLVVLFLVLVSNREGWKFYAIGWDGFHSYRSVGKVPSIIQNRMGIENPSDKILSTAEKVTRVPFIYYWRYGVHIDCDNRRYVRYPMSRQGPFNTLFITPSISNVKWTSVEEDSTMKKLYGIVCKEDKAGKKDE